MIKLFRYDNYRITISEEALLLKPFKAIWDRDKSADKHKALQELGFIYFMIDPRSDYQFYTNEDERKAAVIEGEGMSTKWHPDKVVQDAMKFYASFKPTASLLLEDTRIAIDKLRTLLRDIDLSQLDERGKPIYTLNIITSTIKQIPSLVKELDEAERVLASEMKQMSKARGSGEKTIFEDGINI